MRIREACGVCGKLKIPPRGLGFMHYRAELPDRKTGAMKIELICGDCARYYREHGYSTKALVTLRNSWSKTQSERVKEIRGKLADAPAPTMQVIYADEIGPATPSSRPHRSGEIVVCYSSPDRLRGHPQGGDDHVKTAADNQRGVWRTTSAR